MQALTIEKPNKKHNIFYIPKNKPIHNYSCVTTQCFLNTTKISNKTYYSKIIEINNHEKAFNRLCKKLGDVISKYPWDVAPTLIAGGSALYAFDPSIEDFGVVDFFVYGLNSQDHLIEWIDKLLKHFQKFGYNIGFNSSKNVIVSKNAITLQNDDPSFKTIQLVYINSTSESVNNILNKFDIECCKIGIDLNKLYYNKETLQCVKSKQLIFRTEHILYKDFITYVRRINKYINRGFSVLVKSNEHMYYKNIIKFIVEENEELAQKCGIPFKNDNIPQFSYNFLKNKKTDTDYNTVYNYLYKSIHKSLPNYIDSMSNNYLHDDIKNIIYNFKGVEEIDTMIKSLISCC